MIDWLAYGVIGLSVAGIVAFGWRWFRRKDRLHALLQEIAFERLDNVVIPSGDDGEIQLDHLLLTAQGLLVLHIKEAQGNVFGADKMDQWAVISAGRRYTFSNPQPALLDRIAAVKLIVKDVPVEGRVLFLDGATFSKGIPERVVTIDELRAEFAEQDKAAAGRKIEAFKPYWEQLAASAL